MKTDIYTVAEVAALLGVSRARVEAMIKKRGRSRHLPARLPSSKEIEALVTAGRITRPLLVVEAADVAAILARKAPKASE